MQPKHLLGTWMSQEASAGHSAATATEMNPIFVAPFDCKILAIYIAPITAVTGANTNTTHLNIHAPGAVEIANLDLTSGNNLTADTINEIAITTATSLDKGDLLEIQFEKVGNGLDIPKSIICVEYQAN